MAKLSAIINKKLYKMKELKETIIEAVNDATDTETGKVSISYLDALLDELLTEALNVPDVVGRSEQVKCHYCKREEPCNGAYPEGCFHPNSKGI